MKNLLTYCFTVLLITSCSSTKISNPIEFMPLNSEWNYTVFNGNEFVKQEIESPPLVEGGEKNFMLELYKSIRYPAKARREKIHGTVYVAVIIDELGEMESADVKKGLGYGCDKEALKAVKIACKLNMQPAVFQQQKVKVKFDVPVNFKLSN